MKKTLATIATTGIAAATLLSLPLPVFAQAAVNPCPTQGFGALCGFNVNNIGQYVGSAVTVLLVVAAVVALFFLIWGGIRWITSGGDKAKVEGARSTIISAIVGLVIAFLAFFILQVVLNFFGLSINSITLPKLKGA